MRCNNPTQQAEVTSDCQVPIVLVTGGCGFIGTNLVRHLYSKGYRIKVLDNLSTGRKENLLAAGCAISADGSSLPGVELIVGDIRNQDVVRQAVEGKSAVVHLAAYTGVAESLDNPEDVWDINVRGTLNLLEACRLKGVRKFIFASSNAVLGEQPLPVDETKIPKPLSLYGASKLAGEALCSAYYHSFGLSTVSLRFANCYGPYSEHKTSVIPRFMKWAKEGEPLIIYGDGNQTRDFIHVDDICCAIHLSLVASDQTKNSRLFQVGTGIETTIDQLAALMKEVSGKNLQICYEVARKGEITRNYCDISKATTVLGFKPRVALREGLHQLYVISGA